MMKWTSLSDFHDIVDGSRAKDTSRTDPTNLLRHFDVCVPDPTRRLTEYLLGAKDRVYFDRSQRLTFHEEVGVSVN